MATLDVVTGYTTEKCTDVVASFSIVKKLTEHFNTCNSCFGGLFSKTDDFNFVTDFDLSTVNTTCSNCTTASDGEYVLYWHHEWLVGVTFWSWDVLIHSFHQFENFIFISFVAFKCFEGRTSDYWDVVAREVVFGKKFTYFHFYEFKKLFVVYHVNFVEEYNKRRYANVFREQDVLTSLWHWTVCCRNNEDTAVHLSCTSDHVFNVVSVSWAVNVRIVTLFSFILDVGSVDCDSTFFFFWCVVDHVIALSFTWTSFSKNSRDSSCQSCFTMVNVTNCTNIGMCFGTVEFFFCHFVYLSLNKVIIYFILKLGAGCTRPRCF